MRETIPTLLLALLIIPIFASHAGIVEARTITVPDDYPTIQEAINAATAGNTVFVRNGIYYEHLVVNKTLTLIGEDQHTTIIDGNGTSNVVAIWADSVNISSFTMRNSGLLGYGIVTYSSRNNVSHNIITNNSYGVFIAAPSNSISGNLITNNGQPGVYVYYFNDSNVFENNIKDNRADSVFVDHSHGNNFYRNTITNNGALTIVWGSGNNIYENVIAQSQACGIYFWETSENRVFRNNITNRAAGIDMSSSFDNIVYENVVTKSQVGI